MSTRTPSDEGFLSRWSRRKREGVDEAGKSEAKTGAVVSDPLPPACGGEGLGMGGSTARRDEPGQGSGFPAPHPGPPHRKRGEGEEIVSPPEPEVEMVEPPSLDLIDKDFDLASWLKQNVPETWKLAAMRRAWENDPAIANFENPARDYALDWNTPGGAPGYGPLTESDDIGAMVRGIFGEQPALAAGSLTTEEADGDGMSHPLSSKAEVGGSDAAVREGDPSEAEPVALRSTEGAGNPANHQQYQAPPSPELDGAMQQKMPREPVSVRVRKRGGGAIPI